MLCFECVCVHLVFRALWPITFLSFCAWITISHYDWSFFGTDHSNCDTTCRCWPSVRLMPTVRALLISLAVGGSIKQSHSSLDINEWGWRTSCLLSQVFSLDIDRSFVVLKNLLVLRFYRARREVRVNCVPIFLVLYCSLSLPCSGSYPGHTCALSFAGGFRQVTF